MLQYYYSSSINHRDANEDSLGYKKIPVKFYPEGIWLLIAADGMGGANAGEIYSRLTVSETISAVEEMAAQTEMQFSDGKNKMNEYVAAGIMMQCIPKKVGEINRRVISAAREMDIYGGGSTLAAALVLGDVLITFNVGDSPIYLFSGGNASELSIRDNRAEELVRQGCIERGSDEYANSVNTLTAFIGNRFSPDSHVKMTRLNDGDTLIIGTDGAFGEMTSSKDVASRLRQVSPSGYAGMLCASSAATTYDNQSVIVAVYSREKRSLIKMIKNKLR